MEEYLRNNLVFLRKSRGLTQRQLAVELNYSDKVISKWERGESFPNLEALEQIALYYDCTLDNLMKSDMNNGGTSDRPYQLKVTQEYGPNRWFKYTILFPLIIWVFTSFYDIVYFVLFGLIFLIYWIFYGLKIIKVGFVAQLDGKEIKVINRATKVEMFIDHQLVDADYALFSSKSRLSGKVDNRVVKANISHNIFVKCQIFVE